MLFVFELLYNVVKSYLGWWVEGPKSAPPPENCLNVHKCIFEYLSKIYFSNYRFHLKLLRIAMSKKLNCFPELFGNMFELQILLNIYYQQCCT